MADWIPDLTGRDRPHYLAIADALAEDAARGLFLPGQKLPTHRELAARLGLTVGTASRAYAEAERRGLVRCEVGRGTFVCDPDEQSELLSAGGGVAVPAGGLVDLALNLSLAVEDPDLAGALRDLLKHADLASLMSYPPQAAGRRYRQAGADWIGRHGLRVSPEQVVITAGAQHAITMALSAICRPGDTVLAETLTYPGLKTAARLLNLTLAPLAMDGEGLLPDDLERVARRTSAAVLYSMPTLHNPTTTTMSQARREQLATVIRRCDLQVIEDDVHGLLAVDAPPPLAASLPERVFYIASTSKLLAGGLRVAFVAAPPAAVVPLSFAVGASLWALPALNVEVAARWIADGTAAAVMDRKRREAAARQDLARDLLPAERLHTAARSYFLWLELPPAWSAERFVRNARDSGVMVAPADAFTVDGCEAPPAVRVSLSAVRNRDALAGGLQVLARLLERGPVPEPAIV